MRFQQGTHDLAPLWQPADEEAGDNGEGGDDGTSESFLQVNEARGDVRLRHNRRNLHGHEAGAHTGSHVAAHWNFTDVPVPAHLGTMPNERWSRVRVSPYHGLTDTTDIVAQPFYWVKRRFVLPVRADGTTDLTNVPVADVAGNAGAGQPTSTTP